MSVFGVIPSEYLKTRTRITPNADNFYTVDSIFMLSKVSIWTKKHLKQRQIKYLYISVRLSEKFNESLTSTQVGRGSSPYCASFFSFFKFCKSGVPDSTLNWPITCYIQKINIVISFTHRGIIAKIRNFFFLFFVV